MNIDSYLKSKCRNYGNDNLNRFIDLYENIPDSDLKLIFSKIHFEINELLKYLNSRLGNGHYTAYESRELIKWIDEIREIQSNLKNTNLSFEIDEYYDKILNKCESFLQSSNGSPIPNDFKRVTLNLTSPIFKIQNTIQVSCPSNVSYPLHLIGEGSYGKVFKYKDTFYDKTIVVKRAKKDLTPKELERFKQEFIEMKKLHSPYIVEVFRFDDEKFEYTMEYIDTTLYDFININNSSLDLKERRNIVLQILKAFDYIHSKSLLHRDISLKNILINQYDSLNVVKISDFGLVKVPDSTLTSVNTEFKGSLNDPDLEIYGFNNYSMLHETYALTRVIYFVMTGRTTLNKFKNKSLEDFVLTGIDKDITKRYQNVSDLKLAFSKIKF